jgi:signal transduction histidine kinase
MSERARTPSARDVALAAALGVAAAFELTLTYAFERTPEPGPTPVHFAVVAITSVALVWRRVLPLVVPPLVAVVLAVQPHLVAWPNVYVEIFIWAIAIYSLFAHAPTWRTALLPTGVVVVDAVIQGLGDPDDPTGSVITGLLFMAALLVIAVGVRHQRSRADQATRERDAAEARATEVAAEERARIARELHDVVAHGMSVVVLQARGGRKVVDDDPASARRAFDAIEHVSSDCLDEMRRLLGILRTNSDDAAPLAPQPRLDDLTDLVDQARASGASVDLEVVGNPRHLSPAVELSAYRIAQEALTNALKHATGSHARVRVGFGPDEVTVDVTDDGPGGATPDNGIGHGLIGMRERVELYGGSLRAGAEPDGGAADRPVRRCRRAGPRPRRAHRARARRPGPARPGAVQRRDRSEPGDR